MSILIKSYLTNVSQSLKTSPATKVDEPEQSAAPAPARIKPRQIDALAQDYLTLGVRVGSDLEAVEAAWRLLARRADPKRFPAGSDEEKRAGELLAQINESYTRIRESVNPTEGRFGRLEL